MMASQFPSTRLRRLRYNNKIRDLVREHELTINDVIYPLFIKEGLEKKQAISAMPGQYQLSLNDLTSEIKEIVALKIPAVILFGIPTHKDATGSEAHNDHGIIQQAIRLIKKTAPELLVITDVCCCEYTRHGHCGLMDDSGIVDNDQTLTLLQKQVISHVKAGADVVAPSGMIDGMVAAIRHALDDAGFQRTPILSYSVKYASSFYGPFREAAEGTPQFGDRRSHQMDPGNGAEAMREAELDVTEGADMLMVKPALAYLDIIYRLKQQFTGLPICAYHVSGEYSMIKAAAEKGWINEQATALESLLSIKRAGADMIITYFAKDVARWLG
jgi:porphobilinogen synthase